MNPVTLISLIPTSLQSDSTMFSSNTYGTLKTNRDVTSVIVGRPIQTWTTSDKQKWWQQLIGTFLGNKFCYIYESPNLKKKLWNHFEKRIIVSLIIIHFPAPISTEYGVAKYGMLGFNHIPFTLSFNFPWQPFKTVSIVHEYKTTGNTNSSITGPGPMTDSIKYF